MKKDMVSIILALGLVALLVIGIIENRISIQDAAGSLAVAALLYYFFGR